MIFSLQYSESSSSDLYLFFDTVRCNDGVNVSYPSQEKEEKELENQYDWESN